MTSKQEIDDFVRAIKKKHKGDINAALREASHRTVHFFAEKERLETEVARLESELNALEGSVNE